ncbi:MAG TPA: FAD-dependent oxidoreductase, partial [Candidatus Thermoplasmatota archaeon]|nr:FAD-dependent oxidoreductase [Candidatus Thermoplasmatota archaeon]
MEVLVVGGGILGCSSALALAGRGHEVTLQERSTLGSGSTAKAAGILSAFTWNDDDYRLIAKTRGMVGEIIGITMAAGLREAKRAWRKAESIAIGKGPTLARLDGFQDRLERMAEEVDRLDHRGAAREFPGLRFEPGEEVLVAQEDGVLEAGDLLAALRHRLVGEGVTLRENRPAGRLPLRNGEVEGVAVVVAGGSWTRDSGTTYYVANVSGLTF